MLDCTRISGPMVALATPLNAEGDLDVAGLERLLDRVVGAGVSGVAPVGTTGEGARLDPTVRLDVASRVRTLVPGDIPVISGVPSSTPGATADELDLLAAAGVDAALVTPPSYYPLRDDDVAALYTQLADASPLPLVLYNIPAFTKVRIAPTVVGALAGHPRIIGIKDSSRDMEYLLEVIERTDGRDFGVLTGSDTLLVASLASGAHGTIAASLNLVPELAVRICRRVEEGDLAGARGDQQALHRIVRAARVGIAPAGWKAALAAAGVCEPYLAPPASPLSDADRSTLQRALADEGVLT